MKETPHMSATDATKLHGQEHVDVYLETDGEVGHDWRRGSPVLILTTTGRKSGEERQNALIYGMAGDDPMIVASKGGHPSHPAWYLNLRDQPDVEAQIRGDRFSAHARDATADERPELWKQMTGIWPDYDSYQERTDREIPVVILERAA
jgi:deazaflavin-dependent oxidoreductase (nitroreductase family)